MIVYIIEYTEDIGYAQYNSIDNNYFKTEELAEKYLTSRGFIHNTRYTGNTAFYAHIKKLELYKGD